MLYNSWVCSDAMSCGEVTKPFLQWHVCPSRDTKLLHLHVTSSIQSSNVFGFAKFLITLSLRLDLSARSLLSFFLNLNSRRATNSSSLKTATKIPVCRVGRGGNDTMSSSHNVAHECEEEGITRDGCNACTTKSR